MLVIRINGGLGNQMFQYAMGQEIKQRGYLGDIKYDISSYDVSYAHTGYSLKKYFYIDASIATREQCKILYPYNVYMEGYRDVPEVIRKLFQKYCIMHNSVYEILEIFTRKRRKTILKSEPGYIYDKSLFHINAIQDIYMTGYYQNMNYFQKIDLKQLFQFARPLVGEDIEISKMMKECNSVSVHVRRGDYCGTGYDLCNIEYFKKAVEQIPDKNNVKYFMFTDDVEFVKKNFDFLDDYVMCFHSTENCDFDMQLMTKCKHHIIANSSFGFWGAYLSCNSGITVAPRYWFNDGQRTHEFSLPRDWIIIDNDCGGSVVRCEKSRYCI